MRRPIYKTHIDHAPSLSDNLDMRRLTDLTKLQMHITPSPKPP